MMLSACSQKVGPALVPSTVGWLPPPNAGPPKPGNGQPSPHTVMPWLITTFSWYGPAASNT